MDNIKANKENIYAYTVKYEHYTIVVNVIHIIELVSGKFKSKYKVVISSIDFDGVLSPIIFDDVKDVGSVVSDGINDYINKIKNEILTSDIKLNLKMGFNNVETLNGNKDLTIDTEQSGLYDIGIKRFTDIVGIFKIKKYEDVDADSNINFEFRLKQIKSYNNVINKNTYTSLSINKEDNELWVCIHEHGLKPSANYLYDAIIHITNFDKDRNLTK